MSHDKRVFITMEILETFCLEHSQSERKHLAIFDGLLEPWERSAMLPLWRCSGFSLGAVSTIFCPRGMYVTTVAVEQFVQEHFHSQIVRLQQEPDSAGKLELVRLLEDCLHDEEHHQHEADARAAEGPFPWFSFIDSSWKWVVGKGSFVAAALAKRV